MTTRPYHRFADQFATRNDPCWTGIATCLDYFDQVKRENIAPSLDSLAKATAKATAALFCAVTEAKKNQIADLEFRSMTDRASGRTFGMRLVNWADNETDKITDPELAVSWAGSKNQMASAIEAMLLELKPVGPITIDKVTDWIHSRGGIGGLHMHYMRLRQSEAQKKQDREAEIRRKGLAAEKLEAAKTAGYNTVEEYDAHLAKQAEDEQRRRLHDKFDAVRARLVANAVEATVPMPEGRLAIVHNGRVLLVSEQDEFDLLSCAASLI